MNTVAETAIGKVIGSLDEGVLAFRTIRYGDSIAGANRFLPQSPWSHYLDNATGPSIRRKASFMEA